MNRPTASVISPVLLLLVFWVGSAEAGGNLLTNPDFATDASGWMLLGGTSGVASYDASDGSPAPGSALLTGNACCTVAVAQCVAITANASYDFGGSIEPGPTAPGQAGDGPGIDVSWYTDATCSTATLRTDVLQPTVTGWTRIGRAGLIAPATAVAAKYRIYQYNFAALPNVTSHGDSAFFGPTGTVPVELQSFTID